ncbi:thioredoxin-disulfide reductase [Pseudosulfitobacter pseudonitzschiae]|uniref:thioredoxin-disulfide reductase n=1 Tax=Pseudosulfitobacter pseudonitzschiae TaxID=1402135 RepID=UPI001AF91561|nr:thioredoxin-disulfide reductase [Pseudosulfitobacter pseudonitzschiae]MBM1814105.1 thioredoxin-disulfide reductase [Pseudosulfitobacter pseudonitzschiae]MBM1831098.1 thioredoxin-disulfide reductase [Pseudosulfitobacter pseudonitzschiae]MBM1835965.1 thioredoxin-disulfide reductase [Pseudosulfitobacter pseudonitzschiae]MBM1840811.1 thioredoxin-disulfide reductase [Pseudosulfitobacter pseudonitzschiae]MBM1845201.1 thioredoxin-disulfide reductase [Pseudosulfitobacter pseudonitzschiae]
MGETRKTKVLIIGSGPSGYTAGIYASRAMLEPILVQGIEPGGQLTTTTEVENWPGDSEVQGPDLMVRMEAHAKAMGCEVIGDIITSVDFSKRPFVAQSDSGTVYVADAIILATGARAKWLGLESEEKFKGFGVSACATCDGFFYRGQEIVVIGGGNTAVEEALFLTNFASKVTLIHRRDELRAEMILQDRLKKNPKIETLWFHQLEEVYGTDSPLGVEGVRVKNVNTGEITDIPAKGVFVAIGHAPSNELVKDVLETHMGGYVVTKPDSTETSIPGVFAAGDLTDHKYRQAVTSAGMGCMAALEAERWLAENSDTDVEKDTSLPLGYGAEVKEGA